MVLTEISVMCAGPLQFSLRVDSTLQIKTNTKKTRKKHQHIHHMHFVFVVVLSFVF